MKGWIRRLQMINGRHLFLFVRFLTFLVSNLITDPFWSPFDQTSVHLEEDLSDFLSGGLSILISPTLLRISGAFLVTWSFLFSILLLILRIGIDLCIVL